MVVKRKGLRYSIIQYAKRLLFKLVGFFFDKENWKSPRFWITTLLGLRALTLICREYGMSPFKKSLKGEHVFLTGAGSGIGRLMAIKLGQLGCRLSLSDINAEGLEETRKLCCASNVLNENINI